MIKAEDHRATEEAGDRDQSGNNSQRESEADSRPTAIWTAACFA
jgi:hypothetical protein